MNGASVLGHDLAYLAQAGAAGVLAARACSCSFATIEAFEVPALVGIPGRCEGVHHRHLSRHHADSRPISATPRRFP